MDHDVVFTRLKECFINNKCIATPPTNFNVLKGPTEKIITALYEEYVSISEEDFEDEAELEKYIEEDLLAPKITALFGLWFPFAEKLEIASGAGITKVLNKIKNQVEEILKEEIGIEY